MTAQPAIWILPTVQRLRTRSETRGQAKGMEETIGIYAEDVFPVDFHRFFERSIQQAHVIGWKRPRYRRDDRCDGGMVVCPQDSGCT